MVSFTGAHFGPGGGGKVLDHPVDTQYMQEKSRSRDSEMSRRPKIFFCFIKKNSNAIFKIQNSIFFCDRQTSNTSDGSHRQTN